jgi:chemotaxis response regulator CheB
MNSADAELTADASKPLLARDIVVVGSSLGGVQALPELFSRFPAGIPAAFFVVQHLGAAYSGELDRLIGRHCRLPVSFAADGELVGTGRVYVAPPDANMSLERGRAVVQPSPRESYHRPSINALFRSAAVELPTRVRETVPVDYTARLADIAELVLDFATRPRRPPAVAGEFQARVMIVEDERIVAKILENDLHALHYDVCASVLTGEAAVEAAKRTLPDVILMDIRLAGAMDGTQAASLM